MDNILVAGGAGFIGSHLCKDLVKKNKVICVDNLITGDKENIEELLDNENFQFFECDITKKEELAKLTIDNITHVFHLASPASPNIKSPKSYISFPIETMLANSLGTQNLLEIAKKNNAKFLFASTSEVYGNPTVSPQVETYFGNVNPNGIRSVYDESKRFGEAMVMTYFRKYSLNVTIIRIFNTYGPYMQPDDGRVVSNFINQAIRNEPLTIFGDGKQTRSFCFINDLISGLELAMFSDKTNGEVINLGNPNEQKIVELAEAVKRITNSASEITFEELPQDDPLCRKPDISKAKKLIDWEPKVHIEEGLQKTVEYFQRIKE